jgi:hypothetical protein
MDSDDIRIVTRDWLACCAQWRHILESNPINTPTPRFTDDLKNSVITNLRELEDPRFRPVTKIVFVDVWHDPDMAPYTVDIFVDTGAEIPDAQLKLLSQQVAIILPIHWRFVVRRLPLDV